MSAPHHVAGERELSRIGVREAAARIAAGDLSPVALVEAYLERIAARNAELNIFRTVMAEEAREAAAAAEAAVTAGRPLGSLHGVPIALKDNIAVAGVRMTAGTSVMRDTIASEDAPVVTRLREAGAIILGKLHMSEWAIGATTQNMHFGDCHNPWDPARSAGGSSGGSGAALAADMAPATLGTDTGGSVRVPASVNGVSGLRPSAGRVPNTGTIPVAWTFDAVGPMARRAEDVARLLDVIGGFDPADPTSADVPAGGCEAALEDGADGLRIGLLTGDFRDTLPEETAVLLDTAAGMLVGMGAHVEQVELRGLEAAIEWTADLLLAEAADFHRERLAETPEVFAADVQARLRRGNAVTGPQYARGRQEQRRWRRRLLEAMEPFDLLLGPAVPVPAPVLAESDPLLTTGVVARYISTIVLARLPALVVPMGFTAREGLPMGMQLIGRPFDEPTLLRAAHAYQRLTDWHERRPAAG
jgi:aspartyl-tRNA(Asn)/glutamyl-tRNA(Gln) amidotransferase subunit A